ncbi:MAG: HAMP domain-containing protein [Rhodobacterales bacterium]|nr:HAMP domain-containing protein [Rhodobacterales bacterium]
MTPPLKPPGLRGRLFLAFGAVATMTVAATVVGWIAFTRLGGDLDRVVGRNVPAVTASARLAATGGAIIGRAPALAAAIDEAERERQWSRLEANLDELNGLFRDFDQRLTDHAALSQVVSSLTGNLRSLDENVRRRLRVSARKEELIERLRWASADFLDEVEPLIDDTRFNISLALQRGEEPRVLEPEMARQQALFRINAAGALLAELIGRAANLPDLEALRGTEIYFREIEGRLAADLRIIADVPGVLSLNQALRDIRSFAEGIDGLFLLRSDELEALAEGHDLLDRNRDLVEHLQHLIAQNVEGENRAAVAAVGHSKASIARGKLLTAGAALASLLVAGLVVWLYVGRSLVGRIKRLDDSMRAIAQGDLKAEVPVRGRDEIGAMAGSLRTFRDTLSETQAELVQAAKLAALGQLTAGISHEVNQPLTAIRHYVRNTGLLIDKDRPEDAKANLTRITGLTERAIRIVDSLRSQARKPSGNLRPIDLASVVDNVLTLHERRMRDLEVTLTVDLADSARWVQAGQVRLEQVLLNLVGNALDAMAAAEPRRLVIASTCQDGRVDLRIADTGCGIAPENLKRVFDPFYTTKDVGEGLGLGLSVSYNIIKGFGGTMRAESRPGAGSLFRVTLDAAEPGAPT